MARHCEVNLNLHSHFLIGPCLVFTSGITRQSGKPPGHPAGAPHNRTQYKESPHVVSTTWMHGCSVSFIRTPNLTHDLPREGIAFVYYSIQSSTHRTTGRCYMKVQEAGCAARVRLVHILRSQAPLRSAQVSINRELSTPGTAAGWPSASPHTTMLGASRWRLLWTRSSLRTGS